MDPSKSSYTLIPTTDLDAIPNIADLWPTNNGTYMQQMTNHNNNTMQQISPSNPNMEAAHSLAFARRYTASKPPLSCKLFVQEKKIIIKTIFFYNFL